MVQEAASTLTVVRLLMLLAGAMVERATKAIFAAAATRRGKKIWVRGRKQDLWLIIGRLWGKQYRQYTTFSYLISEHG